MLSGFRRTASTALRSRSSLDDDTSMFAVSIFEVLFLSKMPKKRGEETINIELREKDKAEQGNGKKLDFLRRALYDNEIDQRALATKLGIEVETIDYWFRHDKCYISYFFRIARYTGMKLKIDIRPIDD